MNILVCTSHWRRSDGYVLTYCFLILVSRMCMVQFGAPKVSQISRLVVYLSSFQAS